MESAGARSQAVDAARDAESPRAARREALADVAIFLGSSAAIFGAETALGLPPTYQGLPTIIGAFLIVAAIQRYRGRSFAMLGLARPARLRTLPLWVIAIYAVTMAIGLGVQQIVLAYVDAPPDLSRFATLYRNPQMLIVALLTIWITAAFFEEIVYRGFLLGRLLDIGAGRRGGAAAAILGHALLFGVLHAYQGALGIALTGLVAIIFGLFFVLLRRNLWALILVHGLIDTMGVVQFYLYGVPGQSG
ncbi:MAG: type II CAAX endopeptidase family protein [Pseudomonadota bacterium]